MQTATAGDLSRAGSRANESLDVAVRLIFKISGSFSEGGGNIHVLNQGGASASLKICSVHLPSRRRYTYTIALASALE